MSHVRAQEPPAKRIKIDLAQSRTQSFMNADQIRAALRIQDHAKLNEALAKLRSQLAVRANEMSVSPQDKRLLLVQQWMESSPGAQDLFTLWELAKPRQGSHLALLVSIVSAVLTLLSSHYTYQALGTPIIKTLLSSPWMRRLNSYLGGSHAELTLVTLKLFNAVSNFASGRERKAILEAFAWETKSLPKLLNMRRKAKHGEAVDVLAKPDIRTLYIQFILSFVDIQSSTQVKTAFLEQHRDVFLSIFKGLVQDAYVVARRVLEVCWAGIWSDLKVKRTLKIGLFNETTINHLLKLYDRALTEDAEVEQIPADLVHHFLLAICTRPGNGICFRDRGWYPRDDGSSENTDEGLTSKSKGGKTYNKILGNILKTLKVNEDPRQQELALKIMAVCPELVAGYWAGAALTLEPRLSSKWIANIAFFGAVISLPVPTTSLFLPGSSSLYQPSPPPLATILENILPSVNTKSHMSKGLQSASGLVQHCTALALVKSLRKYTRVVNAFRLVEAALEETDGGQWATRRGELEREVRRRVPEFQVVVAFAQKAAAGPGSSMAPAGSDAAPMEDVATAMPSNAVKAALLSESAQRLLWLYHECLPVLAAEARFDVGKLLQNFSDAQVQPRKVEAEYDRSSNTEDEEAVDYDGPSRLALVRQLHILRLLKESDQFSWAGKAASGHSNLFVLLTTYSAASLPATRTALLSLLRRVLGNSILFLGHSDEVYAWLAALPRTRRALAAQTPDGTPLTDEGRGVAAFIDDCAQRCLKTPYRYIDELRALAPGRGGSGSGADDNLGFSPLLMTVLEQLDAKIAGRLLTPSDVLGLASFIRNLLIGLAASGQTLSVLQAIVRRVDTILDDKQLLPENPTIASAVRREIQLLRTCLHLLHVSFGSDVMKMGRAVEEFLSQVEQVPVPISQTARIVSAYELIDWLRLIDSPLRPAEVKRLVTVVESFYVPSLGDLVACLSLSGSSIWDGNYLLVNTMHRPGFDWPFLQLENVGLANTECRDALISVLLIDGVVIDDVKRAICLIIHRFGASQGDAGAQQGLLLLLASIMKQATSALSPEGFQSLKEYIFVQSSPMKSLCTTQDLPELVNLGLSEIIQTSLEATSVADRTMVADICDYWLDFIQLVVDSPDKTSTIAATVWIQYMDMGKLLKLLDGLSSSPKTVINSYIPRLLHAVLTALQRLTSQESDTEYSLRTRVDQLLALRPVLPDSLILEDMIATAVDACIPIGLSGRPLSDNFRQQSMSAVLARAEGRWACRLDPTSSTIEALSFLKQTTWSTATVRVVSGLIYRRVLPRDIFIQWLSSDDSVRRTTTQLATVLHAFLDSYASDESPASNASEAAALTSQFSRILTEAIDVRASRESCSACVACISLMITRLPSENARLSSLLGDILQSLPASKFTAEVASIGWHVLESLPSDVPHFIPGLIDLGLQWAVQYFAGEFGDTIDQQSTLEILSCLVQLPSGPKPHLVETALAAAVQNRLNDVSSVQFITHLLLNSQLKPLIVNRHLQSILQHPQFFKVCAPSGEDRPIRDAVVHLLYVLFNLHPWNTCQPTHVEPLLRIYRGTLATTDRQLLAIFRLFEVQRKSSVASLLRRWSDTSASESTTALDAVQSLDGIRVLRTCLAFPGWRTLDVETQTKERDTDDVIAARQLYDPVFLVLLFSQVLAEELPASAFAWVELFRTNIIGLLIRCMSCKDGRLREVALCQIAGLWKSLEDADMQEKPHVIYILNLLKDVIPPPAFDAVPIRLPSYTTLILVHALRGIFYPSNFIYPLTARFLLQRPEFDTRDVPMLYGMLYSSSDEWKKDRGWILRFLSDGMVATDDWRVFSRRHTWDLLASMFQSEERDGALRRGVFEVLTNLTRNSQATMSLVLKSSLVAWIEMQLSTLRETESVVWTKILENIVVAADAEKLQTRTNSEWRESICRCLCLLMGKLPTADNIVFLGYAARLILRLSLLPGSPSRSLSALIPFGVKHLRHMEASLDLSIVLARPTMHALSSLPAPPHSAQALHNVGREPNVADVWGMSVEALWRVSLGLAVRTGEWDALSARLLVWRSRAATGEGAGEWARLQAVKNMGLGLAQV